MYAVSAFYAYDYYFLTVNDLRYVFYGVSVENY